MAGNRVILTFLGEDGPLSRAIDRVEKKTDKLGTGLGALSKKMATVGAESSAVQGVLALGTSLVQLSGAALLVPAGVGAAGAAFGTLKLGLSGFGDAVTKGGEDLAKLAPNARAAATEVRALEPAWNAVKATVQGNLFAKVGGDIRELGGQYLPMLRGELGYVATGWNQVARNALGALKAPEALSAVRSVIHATGDSLLHMQEALGAGISGFLTLAGAGAKFVSGAGGGITDVAWKFQAWTQKIVADGSFDRWVHQAGTVLGQFKDVIVNIGTIVATAFSGMSSQSEGLFSVLAGGTGKLADALKTTDSTAALGALGAATSSVSEAFNAVLTSAIGQLAPIIVALAPAVTNLAQVMSTALVGAMSVVGPALAGFAGFLSSVPGLVPVVVGSLFVLWAAVKVGALVTTAVTLATETWAAMQTIAAGASRVWAGAQWLLNAALSANPIVLVVIAIAALVAGIIWAYNNVGWFRDGVDAAFGWIVSVVTGAVDWIVSAWGDVVSFFTDLPSKIGGVADSIGTWFASLPGMIGDGLSAAGSAIGSFFTQLPGWIAFGLGYAAGFIWNFWTVTVPNAVTTGLNFLYTLVQQGAAAAWNFLSSTLPAAIDAALTWLGSLPLLAGQAMLAFGAWLLQSATDAWNFFLNAAITGGTQALDFIATIPGTVGSFLASLPGIVGQAALDAWNGFLQWTQSTGQQALDWIGTVPGMIGDFFANAGSWLFDAGVNILKGLWDGLKSIAQGVLDWISGIGQSIAAGFNAAVGNHSPSVIFRQSAINIGKGFIGGAKVIAPAMIGSVTSTAAPMIDAMRGTAAAASATALPAVRQISSAPSAGGVTVSFEGNTSDALATVIMGLIRTGKIQIKAA